MRRQDGNFTNRQVLLVTNIYYGLHEELATKSKKKKISPHLQKPFSFLYSVPPMNGVMDVKQEITSLRRWPLYMGEGGAANPNVQCVKRRRRSSSSRRCDNTSQEVDLSCPSNSRLTEASLLLIQ